TDDRVHRVANHLVRHDDFQLDLGQKIDRVFCPPVHFFVAALAAEAADFGHGHPVHARARQGILDVLELVVANHCLDFFHRATPGYWTGLMRPSGTVDQPDRYPRCDFTVNYELRRDPPPAKEKYTLLRHAG